MRSGPHTERHRPAGVFDQGYDQADARTYACLLYTLDKDESILH
ncbi:hypothetical protein [Streptomyces virginiae]